MWGCGSVAEDPWVQSLIPKGGKNGKSNMALITWLKVHVDFSISLCIEIDVKFSLDYLGYRFLFPSLSQAHPFPLSSNARQITCVWMKDFRNPSLTRLFLFLNLFFTTVYQYWLLIFFNKLESLKFYSLLQSLLEKETDLTCEIPRLDLGKWFISEFLFLFGTECQVH